MLILLRLVIAFSLLCAPYFKWMRKNSLFAIFDETMICGTNPSSVRMWAIPSLIFEAGYFDAFVPRHIGRCAFGLAYLQSGQSIAIKNFSLLPASLSDPWDFPSACQEPKNRYDIIQTSVDTPGARPQILQRLYFRDRKRGGFSYVLAIHDFTRQFYLLLYENRERHNKKTSSFQNRYGDYSYNGAFVHFSPALNFQHFTDETASPSSRSRGVSLFISF